MSEHEPGQSLELYNPADPSALGYPATLPIEIAMRRQTIQQICEDYKISWNEWERLRFDPGFQKDLTAAVEMLKQEGMSFKVKAKLQAEELLQSMWKLIHAPLDEVPASVRADLSKFIVRVAGYDKQNDASGVIANALQINIDLGQR